MIVGTNNITKRKIIICDEVMDFFYTIILTYNYEVETGGIIVGEIDPLDESIIVTEVSEPFKSDKRSKFHFKRSHEGHQEYMDKLWEESNYKKMYLGEWHTHNQARPIPSFIDINNWRKIEKRNRVSPEMYFIIIGTKDIGVWNIYQEEVKQIYIGDVLK